jgi:Ca-activated chloride channel family protein
MIRLQRKRIRILLFPLSAIVALLLAFEGAAQKQNDEVLLTVTVTDKAGRCADKLSRGDFAVYDGKTAQEISSFDNQDSPVRAGIALDISKSMIGRNRSRMDFIRDMLSYMIQSGRESDEYFIYVFGARPLLLSDWTRDGNKVAENLNKIDFNRREQGTALYDACYAAIEKLTGGGQARRALIIISDGQDSSSQREYKELRNALNQSDVVVYSIGLVDRVHDGLASFGEGMLETISTASGGKAFFPATLAELNKAFEQIVAELRCQYRIGFKPALRDGKWHSIKVRLASGDASKKNLIVRSREGYFAPTGAR